MSSPDNTKRGKKRTLDELENDVMAPNPKRRKVSSQTDTRIILKQDQFNENNTHHNNDNNNSLNLNIKNNQINNHINNNNKLQLQNETEKQNNIIIPKAIKNNINSNTSITLPPISFINDNHDIINVINGNDVDVDVDIEMISKKKNEENSAQINQNQNSNNEYKKLSCIVGLNVKSGIQSGTSTQSTDIRVDDRDCILRGIIEPKYDNNNYIYKYLSIYTDERCLIHAIPDKIIRAEFNERPDRLQALLDMISSEKWNRSTRFIPKLDDIPTIKDICGNHAPSYLSELNNSCSKIRNTNWNVQPGSDTYLTHYTLNAALISAGLVMEATKYVYQHIPPLPFDDDEYDSDHLLNNGTSTDNQNKIDVGDDDTIKVDDADTQVDPNDRNDRNDANGVQKMDKMEVDDVNDVNNSNSKSKEGTPVIKDDGDDGDGVVKKYAVVLNRPPGHHCDGEKYSGYCFLNNTAVAIEKHLNQNTKVLVLDVDVHHGDGTQKIFYSDPTVLTVSFHQFDGNFFPSSGLRTDYGPSRRHAAYAKNINIPLTASSTDYDVLYSLRNLVWKIVDKFKPEIAFYAVGTDGVRNDKANNATLFTPNLYGQIAYELTKHVNLIVVTTEGGYTTKYLSTGMSCVLHGLTDQIKNDFYPSEISENLVLPSTISTVASTLSDLRRVYDFKQDVREIEKIFMGNQDKFQSYSQSIDAPGSFYIPDDYDQDIDDIDDDFNDDYNDFNNKLKKNGNKHHHHHHNHKKKHKKSKKKHKKKNKKKKKKDLKDKFNKESKENPIDLVSSDADADANNTTATTTAAATASVDGCNNNKKSKKDKKSKKKKKNKKKSKKNKLKKIKNKNGLKKLKENKKIVSKTVNKKSKSKSLQLPSSANMDDNNNNNNCNNGNKEVIDLIEDSPVTPIAFFLQNNDCNKNKNEKKENDSSVINSKKKKKKKHKKSKKKKKKNELKNGNNDHDNNGISNNGINNIGINLLEITNNNLNNINTINDINNINTLPIISQNHHENKNEDHNIDNLANAINNNIIVIE